MYGRTVHRPAMSATALVVALLAGTDAYVLRGMLDHVAQAAEPRMPAEDPAPQVGSVGSLPPEEVLFELRKGGAKIEVDEQRPDKPAVKFLLAQPATPAVLQRLNVLPELREVALYGFAIRDADLASLKGLTHLQILRLNYTEVSDEGLAALGDLSEIRSLNLDGNYRLTDGAIRHLRQLRTLEDLSLTFTRLSEEGIEELRRALPKATIHRRYAIRDLVRGEKRRPGVPPGLADAKGDRSQLEEANLRRVRQDWAGLALLLDDAVNARPNEIFPWRMFAWNLAWNLAAEPEEVADRYFWIRQGIAVLLHAAQENPEEGRLLGDVGFFVAFKIGRSDESEQFRRLLADDQELHQVLIADSRGEEARDYRGKVDSWLVARQWFLKAEPLLIRAFDPHSEDGPYPVIFCSQAAMAQSNYASAIQEEGAPDEAVCRAWKDAERQWEAFGNRPIPITKDKSLRMNDLPQADPKQAEQIRTFEAIVNYDHWKWQCSFEQRPATIEARKLLRTAVRDYEAARSGGGDPGARTIRARFEEAFQAFRQLLDAEPAMLADEVVCSDLLKPIALYRDQILRVEHLPEDFPLKPLVERWERKPDRP